MTTPRTYAEAISQGYHVSEKRVQFIYQGQGHYVSRRAVLDDQPIQEAQGKRKGDLFVWWWDSISCGYAVRLYLTR